ncbi:MAG: PH domain-containing protein [Acidimicrobiaceae bacterium]|nr:PH domain-containing protein [Acidimicrobiaceae bacterium]MBO0746803.1 PH domain-containing protein [Acidimicrobiaceae bacterium]
MAIDAKPERPAVEWRTPSPRLRILRRTEVAIVAAVVIALTLAIALPLGAVALGAGLAVGEAVLAVVADTFVGRRVRAWGFVERGEDLMVRRGVMFKRLSVIPYGRMQFVDVTAGPFERSFGLATVQMHTAAAASDARIPGLERAEADRLRDQLTALGESRAAGL